MTSASVAPGRVLWVTGLSGAGKTTVSSALVTRLRGSGRTVVLLDGDVLREIYPRAEGMTIAHRRELAGSYGRLCRELALQGVDVVIATISMFDEVRAWNRVHIKRYVEIFLTVPQHELRKRDPKGIYRRFDAGEVKDVVGLDLPAEFPKNPDLIVENHGEKEPAHSVHEILAWLEKHAP